MLLRRDWGQYSPKNRWMGELPMVVKLLWLMKKTTILPNWSSWH